jgi:hypothetical protein
MHSRLNLWVAVAGLGLLAATAPGCGRRLDAGPQPSLSRGKELRGKLALATEAPAEESSGPATEDAGGRATLSARFRYVGTAAKPAPIDVNKDVEVCGKHPLHVESLEVGADGGVANIVVWLRTRVPAGAETAEGNVVLDNKNCRFEPHVVVMTTKQKLEIKNSDPVGHNSNGVMLSNSPFNPIIPAGQSVDVSLPKEEAMPAKVGCNIHPWMGAWLVIRNDTFAAVSDSGGVLTLKDLPAGRDLEFQLWQERVGFLKDVEVEGVKVDSKGRFKLKLAAGQDKNLEFKVVIK